MSGKVEVMNAMTRITDHFTKLNMVSLRSRTFFVSLKHWDIKGNVFLTDFQLIECSHSFCKC